MLGELGDNCLFVRDADRPTALHLMIKTRGPLPGLTQSSELAFWADFMMQK